MLGYNWLCYNYLQVGSYDCGLFAIAYITGIAHGIEPARFVFEQSNMRRHLYQCFSSGKLTPFPGKELAKNDIVKFIDYIDVHCYCRMPELSGVEMLTCFECCEMIHIFCEDNVNTNNSKWSCKQCLAGH